MMLWLQNLMRRYLERRGWVVFYLQERFRSCENPMCWLNLYETQRKKGKERRDFETREDVYIEDAKSVGMM